MNLTELISKAASPYTTERLYTEKHELLSKSDSKKVFEELEGALFQDHATAFSNIIQYLLITHKQGVAIINDSKFLNIILADNAKKRPLTFAETSLRSASTYYSTHDHKDILRCRVLLFLAARRAALYSEAEATIEDHYQRLEQEHRSFVKSILARAEINLIDALKGASFDLGHQDNCDEVSAILAILYRHIPEPETGRYPISVEYIESEELRQLIELIYISSFIKSVMIRIHQFNYDFIWDEVNELISVSESHTNFEEVIQRGFHLSHTQAGIDAIPLAEMRSLSSLATSMAEGLSEISGEIFKKQGEGEDERYTLILDPLIPLFRDILKDGPHAEEASRLIYLNKEHLLSVDEMNSTFLREGFSIMDFLRVQRVFDLIFHFFQAFAEEKGISRDLLLRSLIPVFQRADLPQQLEAILPSKHVEQYLSILAWRNNSEVLDIRLTPILPSGKLYVIPMAALSTSNHFRNIVAIERRRKNKSLNPSWERKISDKLTESFMSQGFVTQSDVSFDGSYGRGDIDFLAYKDGFLFIAENKNYLLPTSWYDLKNPLAYMRKAESQLDKILKTLLHEPQHVTCQLAFSITIREVKACIVTNQRFFVGCNAFRFPIRSVHEMARFVEDGKIRMSDKTFSSWGTDIFNEKDMINFLDDNSAIRMLRKKIVTPAQEMVKDGKFEIHLNSFHPTPNPTEETYDYSGFRLIDNIGYLNPNSE